MQSCVCITLHNIATICAPPNPSEVYITGLTFDAVAFQLDGLPRAKLGNQDVVMYRANTIRQQGGLAASKST
jgi:hypothetical protein